MGTFVAEGFLNQIPNPGAGLVALPLLDYSTGVTQSMNNVREAVTSVIAPGDDGFATHYTGTATVTGGMYAHYIYRQHPILYVGPGRYTFSVYMYAITAPTVGMSTLGMRCIVSCYNAAGNAVQTFYGIATPLVSGTQQRHSLTFDTPVWTNRVLVGWYTYMNDSSAYDFYADAYQLNEGDLMPYAQGNMAGNHWEGTAHDSRTVGPVARALTSPKLSLPSATTFQLDAHQSEIAKENWVRAGLLRQTA